MNAGKLTIVFTSDEHGQLASAGRLQREILKARQENPQGCLTISCGDIFQGSAETEVLGRQASSDLLRLAGYDYITLGNHEFDYGPEVVKSWIAQVPCPVLNSNVVDSQGQLLPGTIPFVIQDIHGHKVGLIGCTTPDTATIVPEKKLGGIQFLDPCQTVKEQAEKLKDMGVETIGVVSHLGIEGDRQLAQTLPELDFILGGHTHLAMTTAEKVGQTTIVHSGSGRNSLGKLEIDLGQSCNGNASFALRPPGNEADEVVEPFVQQQEAIVKTKMGQVVAHLEKPAMHDPDALNDDMEHLAGEKVLSQTGGQVFMVNQKSIRASLPAGDISKQDIYTVFPFDNTVVNLAMTAGQLTDLYRDSYLRSDQTSLTAVGPLQVACDPKTRELKLFESGQMLDDNQIVTVTTSNYLAEGGLGYFKTAPKIAETFPTFRQVFLDGLEAKSQ